MNILKQAGVVFNASQHDKNTLYHLAIAKTI